MFKGVIVAMTKRDSIMPSRHRRVDMRWDRNISVPSKEKVKARLMLRTAGDIFGNYDVIII